MGSHQTLLLDNSPVTLTLFFIMFKFCIAVCLLALAAASVPYGYQKKCSKNGEYLPNPADCKSYLRCDYGDEPWYDEYGNIKFVAVVKQCAPGTVTDFKNFNYQSPCSVIGDKCPYYRAPYYAYPAYQAPAYQAPAYQAPAYQAPVYQAPSYKAPEPAY